MTSLMSFPQQCFHTTCNATDFKKNFSYCPKEQWWEDQVAGKRSSIIKEPSCCLLIRAIYCILIIFSACRRHRTKYFFRYDFKSKLTEIIWIFCCICCCSVYNFCAVKLILKCYVLLQLLCCYYLCKQNGAKYSCPMPCWIQHLIWSEATFDWNVFQMELHLRRITYVKFHSGVPTNCLGCQRWRDIPPPHVIGVCPGMRPHPQLQWTASQKLTPPFLSPLVGWGLAHPSSSFWLF